MFDQPTRLFLRWRDRGDPAALAKLFDRTAPELLRLALHLCKNVPDAEDALQTTFLAAIESAMRFERGKKVVPWLAGILTHRAMAEHRRRLRAPETGADGDAVSSVADEPARRAEHGEVAASTREALDRLREPYRQPALLRLVHGMEPAEIALVLQRSPGTVRAQLHRGFEQLRRHLPSGLATTLALGAFAGRGLAAVKQVVLAEGARTTATAGAVAGTALATGVIMGKHLVVGIVAVLFVGLALGSWWIVNAGGTNPIETTTSPANVVVRTSGAPEPGATEVPSPVAAAERTTVPAAAPGPSWRLRIQVVDGATGLPLAGAVGSLHGPRVMTLLEVQRELLDVAPPWHNGVPSAMGTVRLPNDLPADVTAGDRAFPFLVPPVTSATALARSTANAEGWFELASPCSGAVLRVEHEGFGPHHASIAAEPPAEQRIELWRLRRVSGFVRTEDDSPLPAPMRLVLRASQGAWLTETDATGHFTAAIAAPQARVEGHTHGWLVTSRILGPNGEKWHGSRERRFEGPETFFVTRFGSTRLHVFDAATKQPIETIGVCSLREGGSPIHCGRFVAPGGYLWLETPSSLENLVDQAPFGGIPERLATCVRVSSEGYRPAAVRDVQLTGPEARTIEVALARGAGEAVSGSITRGGKPAASHRVQLRPHAEQWRSGNVVLACDTTTRDGAFSLPAPAGDYVLDVFDEGRLCVQMRVDCPTPAPLAIELDDAVFVDVLVVDAKGTPRSRHNVSVRGAGGAEEHGRTDETGHLALGPFSAGTLRVRAPLQASEGSWSAKVFAEVVGVAGSRPTVTLQLPNGDLVRVALAFDGAQPAGGFAGFLARDLWQAGAKDVTVTADGGVPIDITPGNELQITAGDGRRWVVTVPDQARSGHVITLRWAGLAYAGTLCAPSQQPLGDVWVYARPVGGGACVSVRSAADGTFRLDGLEPCSYSLSFASELYQGAYLYQRFKPQLPPAAPAVVLALELRMATAERPSGHPELTVTGRVADGAGAPVVGKISVWTFVDQEGGTLEVLGGARWHAIDTDGRYQMTIPRGSRYLAAITRAGKEERREEFTLPPNATTAERNFVVR